MVDWVEGAGSLGDGVEYFGERAAGVLRATGAKVSLFIEGVNYRDGTGLALPRGQREAYELTS